MKIQWVDIQPAPTLLEQVKALARELSADKPPEFFDGLSQTTLGYLLVSLMCLKRERDEEDKH